MKMNTLPKEVLKKIIDGWARANGTDDHEIEAWYNNDAFNGFRMKDCLTFDEYKAIWLEEEKKMIEFFKVEEQRDPWDDIELPEDWLGHSIPNDEDLPFQAGLFHMKGGDVKVNYTQQELAEMLEQLQQAYELLLAEPTHINQAQRSHQ